MNQISPEPSLYDLPYLWAKLLRSYPSLGCVEWVKETDESSVMQFVPGPPPTLYFPSYAPLAFFENFLETRRVSCELVAATLEIPLADLTPKLLRSFIFLHECGHAQDFVINFAGFSTLEHPENAKRRFEEACMRCDERRDVELTKLSIPITPAGFLESRRENPSYLATLIQERGGSIPTDDAAWDLYFQDFEREYKSLPSEVYADTFARGLLQSLM